jgi:hypothetical protein
MWRFDESGGQQVLDDGPGGLTGRLGATSGTDDADPARIDGRSGRALRFGAGQYVHLPSSPLLAPATVTVEAVVRSSGSPGEWRYVFSRGAYRCDAGSYGLYSGVTGGLAFYVFDGTRYYVTPAARVEDAWDGRWHHVAGTFDGATVRLYVDGREVGAGAAAPITAIDYGGRTSTDAYVGDYRGTCTRPFTGDIDLVRVWSGALSPAEVASAAALSGSAVAPGAPSLAAAAPGTVLSPTQQATPPRTPAACRVAITPRAWRAGTRRVQIRVTAGGKPVRRVGVRIRRGAATMATGRTGADGRVTLRLRAAPKARSRLTVAVGRKGCGPLTVRVGPGRRGGR